MTSEEMERAIEFVLGQQAQLVAGQQGLATDIRLLTDAHLRTEQTLGTVVDVLARLAQSQIQLAEAQKRTDEALAQTNEALERTNEALAETDERLNSLIVVVERYFSNGRKGDQ